ncbi:MAG: iron chelate uptake ABC transporter family permease subunit [Aeromicrobium sp.]|uniref:FecCD family ABC transporter permease n=1 Tax=Aeromicrobium sp. TaxID=1871063 RepID=UPI0039E24714
MGARVRSSVWWPRLLWGLGLVALAASLVVAVAVGSSDLTADDIAAVVRAHLFGGESGLSRTRDAIVWELRTPRVLLAALCGAGLAVCGAVFQSLLRNPLADPFILGVSSGAGLGAVLVLILGVGAGVVGLASGAFVGAVGTFALVIALARLAGRSVAVLVLAGVAIAQFCSALTSFVLYVFASAHETRGMLFWLMGSLSSSQWDDVLLAVVVVTVGVVVCLLRASTLDAFTFGEDAASSLGVDVARTRFVLLTVTTLMTAALVASSGAVGFVGLTLPHAARALVGVKHRVLLPTSALLGAIFLVWADTFARTVIAPQELPVGIMTALVGVPMFVAILVRQGLRAKAAGGGA